jgi:membrane protein
MADDCGVYAAAIAYYAIFSLVPVSLITLSIFGLVVDRERIVNFVFEQLPLQQTPSVRENVDAIVQRARQVSPAGISFGLLALVWSATGIFSAVRRGLNATAHRRKGRPYWHGKLMDIALIPSLGLLITLSVGLTAVAQVAVERAGDLGVLNVDPNLAVRASTIALSTLVSFVMFALLYRYVPTVRPNWPEALAGAAFGAALFELAKNLLAYAFSVSPFTRDTAIYAGFSTALIFLFWMFVNASILLLGSEFARAVARHAGEPGAVEVEAPRAAGRGPRHWPWRHRGAA